MKGGILKQKSLDDVYYRITQSSESQIKDDDDAILADMGYKQELDRSLGVVMNFAFGFTEVMKS